MKRLVLIVIITLICVNLPVFASADLSGQETNLLIASEKSKAVIDPWTQRMDLPSNVRNAGIGFSIDSLGFIGTGWDNYSCLKDFWSYNVHTNTWTQKADFAGQARYYAFGYAVGSKGYVGAGTNGITYFNDMWEYDSKSNQWTQKADFSGGGRARGAGFALNGKIYFGTGFDGRILYNDLWEYDPIQNTWYRKRNIPGDARWSASGFALCCAGYIGTGWDQKVTFYKDFYKYDPCADNWARLIDFPGTNRDACIGFSIGKSGYLAFGYDGDYLNELWRFDPSEVWTKVPDCPGRSRYGAVAFSIGTRGYLGTGRISDGRIADFWEYTPDSAQASLISFSDITPTSVKIYWVNGNMDKRVVFMTDGSGNLYEIYGQNFVPHSNWNTKGTLFQDEQTNYYCIHNAIDNSVTVENLSPNTTYTVRVFEYSEFTYGNIYLQDRATGNPNSFKTNLHLNSNQTFVDDAFNVFPNPANDFVTIRFNSQSAICPYFIYDMSGKLLNSGNIESNNQNVGITNLSNGIYLFVVKDQNMTFSKRIIKN